MILRRFMQHIKDQNWFAVGLDVVVVIVGIFLGMQVTEWNDKRVLAQQEVNYLQVLGEDLKRLNSVFERKIEFEDNRAKLSSWTYGLLEQDNFIKHKDKIAAGMIGLTDRRTVNFSSPVYTELLSSGKLILIQDESLRKDIIAFFSDLEFYQRVLEKNSKQFIDDSFHVFVAKRLPFFNIDNLIPTELVDTSDVRAQERQKKLLQSNVIQQDKDVLNIAPDDPLWGEFKRELSWRAMISVADGDFVARIIENSNALSTKINNYLMAIQN